MGENIKIHLTDFSLITSGVFTSKARNVKSQYNSGHNIKTNYKCCGNGTHTEGTFITSLSYNSL